MGDIVHSYDHLNEEKEIGLSIPEIAKQLMKCNYGQQRMLSAILFLRENSDDYLKYKEHKRYTDNLRSLLENGWY